MTKDKSAPSTAEFLSRWSKRKLETQAEPDQTDAASQKAEPPADIAPAPSRPGRMITEPLPSPNDAPVTSAPDRSVAAAAQSADPASQSDPEASTGETANEPTHETEEDLAAVDIEALDYGSDFKRFMRPGVPEELRQRALKKLWHSDPVLANLDGLNDYDEDFSYRGAVGGVLKTAYRVGKGYLTDEEYEERERKSLADQQPKPTLDEVEAEKANAEKANAEKASVENTSAGEQGEATEMAAAEPNASEAELQDTGDDATGAAPDDANRHRPLTDPTSGV